MCARAGAAAERRGGARDPLLAPPQHRPQPHAPYSAWQPRSVRCAQVQAPASAPAQLPALASSLTPAPACAPAPVPARMLLRSSSGSGVAGGAPLLLRLLGAQGRGGRGGAEPSRPAARDPKPRQRRLPEAGRALPCRSPARPPTPPPPALAPQVAEHLLGLSSAARRLRGLRSAALPPPGPFLEWGDAGEGHGLDAPLCAQLARRPPAAGGAGASGWSRETGCREMGEACAPVRRVRTDRRV